MAATGAFDNGPAFRLHDFALRADVVPGRANARRQSGHISLLAVLLGPLDAYADDGRPDAAFDSFMADYGAPAPRETSRDG